MNLKRSAATQGVSVERLLEIMVARLRMKGSRAERRRGRRRRPLTKATRRREQRTSVLHAGQGRFHELLKIAGLDEKGFAAMVLINKATVYRWNGFPMTAWPELLLELLIWKKNASTALAKHGYTQELFNAGSLPPAPDGRYPRTTDQGKEITDALGEDAE